MKNDSTLILTQNDFQTLSGLALTAQKDVAALLEEELDRATIVSADDLPSDVVTMNSTVRFADLESKKEMVVTLVYPHEANTDENKISVLAPIGMALIGLRIGQIINWTLPHGKEKIFKIVEVISQPAKN